MIIRFFYSLIILFSLNTLHAQVEICNNGIDDDMDGLIDCFDDDCCLSGSCDDFWYDSCLDDDCLITEPSNLVIESQVLIPGQTFATFINFVVGDLEGDGNNEIVILGSDDNLYVLDASTQTLKFTINVSLGIELPQLLIADVVLTSPGAEIIYFNGDDLYAFSAVGATLWTNPAFDTAFNLSAADFNQDGIPEIYSSNRIFNGATGEEIILIPEILSASINKDAAIAIDILPDSACPDCSGLELVTDSKVYAINIVTATFSLQHDNSAAMSGSSISVCADWDNDGILDVLSISDTRIAVWSPIADVELYNISISEGLRGLPNINDIDGDGLPELVYISDEGNGTITTLNNDLSTIWSRDVGIIEKSGYTAVTMFDFDANGTLELVYRDERRLGMLNAQDGEVIEIIDCTAVTQGENPIVVDYNNDDEAEILVVCGVTFFDSEGLLTAFSSGGTTTWADCRSVWNQESYFNVHINDDLTVPAVQQLQHLSDIGTTLNGFLNQYQIPRTIETNLKLNSILAVDCETIRIEICNTRTESINESVSYTLYYGDPMVSDVPHDTEMVNVDLAMGECMMHEITIAGDYTGELFIIINDAGTASLPLIVDDALPNTSLLECPYIDNILSVDVANCEEPDCADLALTALSSPSCGLIAMEICNQGGTTMDTVLQIVAYNSEGEELLSVFNNWTENINLLSGECLLVNYTIPPATAGDLVFNINDNGSGDIPFDIDNDATIRSIFECDFSNNYALISLESIDVSFSLGSDLRICADDSVSIVGPSGSFSYEWNTGNTTQNISASTAGTYTLSITDNCGNSASDEVNVTLGSDSNTQIEIDLCSGDSLMINGEWVTPTTPSLALELTNFIGCDSIVEYIFTYKEPSAGTLTVVKCPGESYTFPATGESFSMVGSFELALTNAAGCDSLLTLTIEDSPQDIPILTIVNSCVGESNGSITIDFEDTDISDYTYEWTNDVSTINEADGLTEEKYFITITDTDGCPIVLEADIETSSAPDLLVDHTDIICAEESGIISLNTELNLSGFSVNMEAAEGYEIQNLNVGTYNISFTGDDGCEFVESISISSGSEINVSLPDTIFARSLIDFPVEPTVSDTVSYSYLWSDNDNISCTACQSTVVNSTTDLMLELLVSNEDGCTKTISTYIKIIEEKIKSIYIPNVFYPNSQNVDNATFKVFSSEPIAGLSIEVFDRWGEVVYTSEDSEQINSWNGTFKGEDLMSGVYVYIIEVRFFDGSSIKESGDITILR